MFQLPGLSLLLGVLVALVFVRYLVINLRRRSRLPPGPKPAPLIGNLHQLPKHFQWLHLYRWSKRYGPIMHLSMAGQPLIVLSTHQAATDLLNRRGARYSDRPRMVMAGELVTKGFHMLLRPYDERYKLHQRMEAPVLSLRSASAYRPLQDMESRQLLFDVVSEHSKEGSGQVDFHHHFQRATASFMYSVVYGYRLQTGHEQELMDAKRIEAEFTRTGQVGAYIVDSFPFLNYLPSLLAPWKKEAEELYELERQLHVGNLSKGLSNLGWNVSKHMKGSPEAADMSTEEFAFDAGILADAGLDTSTVALCWFIVAWITSGSRWVTRAQKLLDEVVGRGRLPSFEDRPKLAYIDAIVNETTRWRPVAPGGVPHFIKSEDVYNGYLIPANSIVLPNMFAITREESVFGEDADRFIPERWLAKAHEATEKAPNIDICGMNATALKDLPQSAFGFGRRACTGRIIARNQLFIHMARLLWAFDIDAAVDETTGQRESVDDMDCLDGFITRPKLVKADIRPRGDWARELILRSGTTHGIDHSIMLGKAGMERA